MFSFLCDIQVDPQGLLSQAGYSDKDVEGLYLSFFCQVAIAQERNKCIFCKVIEILGIVYYTI
jgi:hypothetical protein